MKYSEASGVNLSTVIFNYILSVRLAWPNETLSQKLK